MDLQKVTVTGADDSTAISEIVRITEEFPFVEWGILASHSSAGRPRFPSQEWIERLLDVHHRYRKLPLCLHVCGKWVREICCGEWRFASRFGYLVDFQRVQLNFHAHTHDLGDKFFRNASHVQKESGAQIIFQCDSVNDRLLDEALENGLDAVPLFDRSGGAGIVPDEWPTSPDNSDFVGYAGGLGCENLDCELPKIAKASRGRPFWIDAETKLRPQDGVTFDLGKVEHFLSIAAQSMGVRSVS